MMDCPHRPAPRIMASTVSNLRCSSASLNVNSVVSTCTTQRGTSSDVPLAVFAAALREAQRLAEPAETPSRVISRADMRQDVS